MSWLKKTPQELSLEIYETRCSWFRPCVITRFNAILSGFFCGRFRLIGMRPHGWLVSSTLSVVVADHCQFSQALSFIQWWWLPSCCMECVTYCVLYFKKHFILMKLHIHSLLLFGIIFQFHCRNFIISCNQTCVSYWNVFRYSWRFLSQLVTNIEDVLNQFDW